MRPGDVLTASNGKTIEVINTDAEGRLTRAAAFRLSTSEFRWCLRLVETVSRARTIVRVLESHGLRESLELSKVRESDAETTEFLPSFSSRFTKRESLPRVKNRLADALVYAERTPSASELRPLEVRWRFWELWWRRARGVTAARGSNALARSA